MSQEKYVTPKINGTTDYYKVLGVSPDADEATIKNAFRKESMKSHPDKNLGREKEVEPRFQDLAEAYETLQDKDKRQQYDHKLAEAEAQRTNAQAETQRRNNAEAETQRQNNADAETQRTNAQ